MKLCKLEGNFFRTQKNAENLRRATVRAMASAETKEPSATWGNKNKRERKAGLETVDFRAVGNRSAHRGPRGDESRAGVDQKYCVFFDNEEQTAFTTQKRPTRFQFGRPKLETFLLARGRKEDQTKRVLRGRKWEHVVRRAGGAGICEKPKMKGKNGGQICGAGK